jgi:hypothetical protein
MSNEKTLFCNFVSPLLLFGKVKEIRFTYLFTELFEPPDDVIHQIFCNLVERCHESYEREKNFCAVIQAKKILFVLFQIFPLAKKNINSYFVLRLLHHLRSSSSDVAKGLLNKRQNCKKF